jgi:hypothetical protein
MGQMFSVVSFLPARGIVQRGLFEDKYDEPTIQMLMAISGREGPDPSRG